MTNVYGLGVRMGVAQLEEECRNGVWFPAACSANLIVKDQSFAQGPADMWHQVTNLQA